jgi:hypothetical protein
MVNQTPLPSGYGTAVAHPIGQSIGIFVLLLFFVFSALILMQETTEPSRPGPLGEDQSECRAWSRARLRGRKRRQRPDDNKG